MAPPTTKPRLSQLDPDALAQEIEQRLIDHVVGLGLQLDPGVEVRVRDRREGAFTQIGESVRSLARYARDGGTLDADVHEYLVSLIPLYAAPLGDAPTDVGEDADPSTPLGCAMIAALAREAIGEGRGISAVQIATLASCDAAHVRLLARQGELALADGEVAAREAKRWLSGRGVPGFGR